MDRVILQVPMPKTLKLQAEAVASDYGFSSLQEIIRIILTKLSRREIIIDIIPPEYIKLSPAAKKRYKKMEEDIKHGRNVYYAKDADDFLKQLRS